MRLMGSQEEDTVAQAWKQRSRAWSARADFLKAAELVWDESLQAAVVEVAEQVKATCERVEGLCTRLDGLDVVVDADLIEHILEGLTECVDLLEAARAQAVKAASSDELWINDELGVSLDAHLEAYRTFARSL